MIYMCPKVRYLSVGPTKKIEQNQFTTTTCNKHLPTACKASLMLPFHILPISAQTKLLNLYCILQQSTNSIQTFLVDSMDQNLTFKCSQNILSFIRRCLVIMFIHCVHRRNLRPKLTTIISFGFCITFGYFCTLLVIF